MTLIDFIVEKDFLTTLDEVNPVTSDVINSTEFPRGKRIDGLLDRDCVILDGVCDCPKVEGKLPDCRLLKD